jgi:phosphoribosyl 1,2-cyclic phosphodiesterase
VTTSLFERIPPASPVITDPAICVLASGSGGNCSVLRWRENGRPRVCLVDMGLSPKKTKQWLRGVGTNLAQVDCAVLTHLDRDHCHIGWSGGRTPSHITVRMHKRHLRRAEAEGMLQQRTLPFEREFEISPGVSARAVMQAHDAHGVAAFRFEFAVESGPLSLGYATDLGRATDEMIDALAGVHVLALESNYCPLMQAESDRPEFLKRRITGGKGHLSNEECADATRRIMPREHLLLLHLSRECNTPDLARSAHDGSSYGVTIARQDRPTRWVPIGEGRDAKDSPVVVIASRESSDLYHDAAR